MKILPKVGAALARWMINRIVKMNAVIYIHGKGGSAAESEHYKSLFPDCEVIGLDYKTFTPWETGKEIAYFISPIVDMEKLITNMMQWANVTEQELESEGVIHTDSIDLMNSFYSSVRPNNPSAYRCQQGLRPDGQFRAAHHHG